MFHVSDSYKVFRKLHWIPFSEELAKISTDLETAVFAALWVVTQLSESAALWISSISFHLLLLYHYLDHVPSSWEKTCHHSRSLLPLMSICPSSNITWRSSRDWEKVSNILGRLTWYALQLGSFHPYSVLMCVRFYVVKKWFLLKAFRLVVRFSENCWHFLCRARNATKSTYSHYRWSLYHCANKLKCTFHCG